MKSCDQRPGALGTIPTEEPDAVLLCGGMPPATAAANGPRCRGAADLAKMALDVCVSLALLAALLPLFAVIAVLVKLDSRGPVLFFQRRCGLGGRDFLMLKFRTMVEGAEARRKHLQSEVDGPMFKLSRDPRVTRVGRYLRMSSFDELPQLVNVLRGEMSLVGPRPLAREEMSGNGAWMQARLSVRPGMTGLWQVKGRASRRFSDWVRYDTEYVQTRSLLGDLKILLLTIPAVLRRRGAV
jgi:lipopolysaccharide/colanic/teichoic acid biosynthesis glycosyltransferase